MISILKGQVEERNINSAVIDVGGVGYEVYITSNDLSGLRKDEFVKLFIYEHIREQSHDLFGFLDKHDKFLFEQLLSVNGVGPKMALSVINTGSGQSVKNAISSGNVKILQSASGVGKKVAERIVVDLKDKVGIPSSDDATAFLSDIQNNEDEAFQALISLGYSPQDATRALAGIDNDNLLSVEERITQALRSPKR